MNAPISEYYIGQTAQIKYQGDPVTSVIDNNCAAPVASEEDDPKLGRLYPWYVVGVLAVIIVFSYLDRQIIVMLVDPIRKDLGISEVQISLLSGFAFAFIYAVCGIPLGWAADCFSRRLIIFAGIIFWGLATVSCGFAASFGQLFLGRVGVGIGEAVLSPCIYSIVADIFPKKRLVFATSIMALGSPIGMGLSFLIGGWIASMGAHGDMVALPLIGQVSAWQAAFIIAGLPGPLLALLMLTINEPVRRNSIKVRAGTTPMKFTRFFRDNWKFLSCYIFGFGLLAMGLFATQSWGAVYLSRVFGWSGTQIGATFGVAIGLGISLALIFGGLAVDYFYTRGMKDAHMRLYAIASIVVLPIAVGSIALHDPWIFLVGVFVWQVIISGSTIAGVAAMQLVTPNEFRGRLIGMSFFVSLVGGLGLGPLFVAMLTQYVFREDDMVGWSLAISLAFIYPAAAFILWKGAKYMREFVKVGKA